MLKIFYTCYDDGGGACTDFGYLTLRDDINNHDDFGGSGSLDAGTDEDRLINTGGDMLEHDLK